MADAQRLDVLLHRLCLTRSRSEAKAACDAGRITVGGNPARPSQMVSVGAQVTLRFRTRTLEIEVLELPGKSVSKQAARELYGVVRDERHVRGSE